MKKYLPFIFIATLLYTLSFPLLVSAQEEVPRNPDGGCPPGYTARSRPLSDGQVNEYCIRGTTQEEVERNDNNLDTEGGWFVDILAWIPGAVAIGVLTIVSWILWFAGALLNTVIQYTVVDMSENLKNAGSINTAWTVIRDIANIGFIFVLLYAAIETILGIGKDNQRLIMKVVLVAILLNFSLFFTKFIIDVSNVLALTFYDAIAPGALAGSAGASASGIAEALMAPLKFQSIMDAVDLGDGSKLLIIGVIGSIFMLIASFVFLAMALLFIIRFVVLIFVLILSPIAFVSFILPKMEKYRTQWWDALSGQAFFAPIYFLLTWIVVVLIQGIFAGDNTTMADAIAGRIQPDGSYQAGDVTILLNFIIIIVLLIASLIIAKEWANKAGQSVGKLTSWATGVAGGATFGMAGRLGRNTLGAGASRLTQSENFQRWAGKSFVGERLFKGTQRTARSSFDVRGIKAVGGSLPDAGEAQKGGQEATIQNKIAAREKFAESLRAPARAATATTPAKPSAKEAYAKRISGGLITHGGTRNSTNTIMGTLGRGNRIAASKLLNSQLAPLETQEQNLQNRESQLSQQLPNATSELATLTAIPVAARTPQQAARFAVLNGPVGTRGSVAYIQDQLTTTQTRLTNVTAEIARIRAIITSSQLDNPANPIINPVTGAARNARADEQNY